MLEVLGWDWSRNRPSLGLVSREMQDSHTTIQVEVPAGTLLAFGRKSNTTRHKSKFHYCVVLADGSTMELPSHVIKQHFAGRV